MGLITFANSGFYHTQFLIFIIKTKYKVVTYTLFCFLVVHAQQDKSANLNNVYYIYKQKQYIKSHIPMSPMLSAAAVA